MIGVNRKGLAVALCSFICFFLAGCQRDFIEDSSAVADGEGTFLTFSASLEGDVPTRTQLDENWVKTMWSANEVINIFYGASAGSRFYSTNTEPALSASFEGTLSGFTGATEDGTPNSFWAVYPYSANNSSTGSSVTVTVPSSQSGIVKNIPESAQVLVAKSYGLSLTFRQVTSRLRLRISTPGITSIVVRGNNGEIIAGRVGVTMEDDVPVWSAIEGEGATEITLKPASGSTFEYGDDVSYFLTLLPQTFENGYSVTFYGTDKYGVLNKDGLRTFSRLGYNGARSSEVTEWLPLDHPSNEIWYTTSDGSAISCYTTSEYEVISPEDNGGVGIVRFPSALTSVSTGAFSPYYADDENNKKITSIILPETVTTIGQSAFSNCHALNSIEMPGVKYILEQAFYSCAFTTINLPDGLIGIGSKAFEFCNQLTNVHIPESVVALGYPWYFYENPFIKCTSLESFSGKFATDDGLALLSGNGSGARNVLVSFAIGAMEGGTYTIPDGVMEIAERAFTGAKLAEVDLNGLTYLSALSLCDNNIKRIHIPSTVISIGAYALAGCEDLEYIRIDVTKSLPTLGKDAFEGSTCPIYVPAAWLEVFKNTEPWSDYADRYQALPAKNEIVYFADSKISVPNMSPSSHDFADGRGVLTFDAPVTVIPESAFYDTAITGVFLPEGVTEIREDAFWNCTQLTSISLPGSLQYLGASAFELSGLTSVTIPESVEHIGCNWNASPGNVIDHAGNPFKGCFYLTSFSGKYATSDGLFLVDDGYLVSGAVGAGALDDNLSLPLDVTTVGFGAFTGGRFSTMYLANAQVLETSSFYDCENLSFFDMGSSVTEIGREAFAMPDGMGTGALVLVNFILMEDLPSVSSDAFKNRRDALELRITGWHSIASASLKSGWGESPIKDQAVVSQHWNEVWVHFANGSITNDFLDSVKDKFLRADGQTINFQGYGNPPTEYKMRPSSLFAEGMDGKDVFVMKYKDGIDQVADGGFNTTGNVLDWISLPMQVATIGEDAFLDLTKLKKFPGADNPQFWPINRITSIGDRAFSGCESMGGTVPLPYVTSLGIYAFAQCESLTDVTLGAVTDIRGFSNCTSLKNVLIDDGNNGAGVTSISEGAFEGCLSLINVRGVNETTEGVRLPGVTYIGRGAFLDCWDLPSVHIASTFMIDRATFENCMSLESVTLDTDKLERIGDNAFDNCPELLTVGPVGYASQVRIPNVRIIGTQAFSGCLKIRAVYAPAATTVGDKAFAFTRGLVSLQFGPNLTTLGAMIFYDKGGGTARNYNKLSIYFAGPYPTSLYSVFDGTTPTFCYEDDPQDFFWPDKVYVPARYENDYRLGFADDWDQSVNVVTYTP